MGFHGKFNVTWVVSRCLLLIALLCLFTPTSSALKRVRERCTMGMECESGYCHPHKQTCECGEVKDYQQGKKVEQYYDNELGMCFSRVGQICTMDTATPDLLKLQCIPDAICTEIYNSKVSRKEFGSCNCKVAHQPIDHGRRCISNVELRTQQLQVPSSMDQVWPNRSGSSSPILSKSYVVHLLSFVAFVCSSQFSFR